MNDSLMQRALQRSADYNIPLSEAIEQVYQLEREAQMQDDFDARQEELLFPSVSDDYDHLERDHDEEYIPDDDGWSDVEADADTLASAGMGTDEDYGYFGGDEY